MIKIEGRVDNPQKQVFDPLFEYYCLLRDSHRKFDGEYGFYMTDEEKTVHKLVNLTCTDNKIFTQMMLYLPCGQLTYDEREQKVVYEGSKRVPYVVPQILNNLKYENLNNKQRDLMYEIGTCKFLLKTTEAVINHMDIARACLRKWSESVTKQDTIESITSVASEQAERLLKLITARVLARLNYTIKNCRLEFENEYIKVLYCNLVSDDNPNHEFESHTFPTGSMVKIFIYDASDDIVIRSNTQGTVEMKEVTK